MSLIKTKQEIVNFPLEVFGEEIKASFEELANEYSVPVNFFGATALFTIASLSGNMYRTELNGRIKTIIYAMLLGPSSLGKTVVYDKLCGDIIQDKDEALRNDYVRRLKQWNEQKESCKASKFNFTDPMPTRTIRTATNGTLEAFKKYAENSPAGFGVYFDEGKQLYAGGQYQKENHSVDFWNAAWNGKTFNELRVDSERERYVTNPSISILAGMQADRVNEMFTKDTIASGLLNRFLFSASGYIRLNESIDHFNHKKEVCDEWKRLVRFLFDEGVNYIDFNNQTFIGFKPSAKTSYNNVCEKITKQANELISDIKDGDESKMMVGYLGKLYAYLGRFVMICAICRNSINPVIDDQCVLDAEKIYNYFRFEAKKLLIKINDEAVTNLNESESKLLKMLPDKFTTAEAKQIAGELKLSDSFFGVAFNRKYKNGYLIRNQDRTYCKVL
jgi:hypothetical protein